MTPTQSAAAASLLAAVTLAPAARPEPDLSNTLTSADTTVTVTADDNGPILSALCSTATKTQWLAGPAAIALPKTATVDGKPVALAWHYVGKTMEVSPSWTLMLAFHCDEPKLHAVSTWSLTPGPGPIRHSLSLANQSGHELVLPVTPTVAFSTVAAPASHTLESWRIEKGAGKPGQQGIHRKSVDKGFAQAVTSGPYSGDWPRDDYPLAIIHDPVSQRGFYVGIESSGWVSVNLARKDDVLLVAAGLLNEKDASMRLAAGETLNYPPVFVGCFEGDVDDGCNRLRRWVDKNLRPPCSDPKYPLLVNNSWGSGMGVDEKLARKMIDESADLGMELFGVDAGWFRGVGDWMPNSKKFPNGLAPVADYARSKGLKFGMWLGWTQAGVSPAIDGYQPLSVANASMKPWFGEDAPENYKPNEYNGKTVCLSEPKAADWCLAELRRMVKDYKLDMLEHDQPIVLDKCIRTDHGHTASRVDTAHRNAQAYYRLYDTLRKENPGLIFEDCVNGGRMVDYGVVRRVDYICVTDVYDPLSNRQAFYDASYVLPPAMCEVYVEHRNLKTTANFVAMLRSGMMGWCTIMQNTAGWSPERRVAGKAQFALYKSRLRPLIVNANLYHVTARPDGIRWDALQYHDPASGKGATFVFRGTTPDATYTAKLKGLDPAATYVITSQDKNPVAAEATGESLMKTGLALTLPETDSSDIIFVEKKP